VQNLTLEFTFLKLLRSSIMPNEFGRLNINFKPVIPLVPHIPVDAAVPIDLGGIQQGTPLSGTSTKNDVAGVTGRHGSITAAVDVVPGQAPIQAGVYGSGRYGVQGESKNQGGVWGNNSGGGSGVVGTSDKPNGIGVLGRGAQLGGMFDGGVGVWGTSKTWMGVYGTSESTTGGAGVMGESTTGGGVLGVSHGSHGGVVGANDWSGDGSPGSGGNGGWFESAQGEGVRGWSKNPDHGGVVGVNTADGVGVYGEGRIAGFFNGDVEVTGDIRLANADCAEDFDVAGAVTVEPGTVMVLGHEGALLQSQQAYDKRVAGVISGAGDYKPGIILDKQQASGNRQPVALLGKVFCKVDAQFGPIEVGDLLTTSPTPGHAMKTSDPFKAFGAVIGKALRPLTDGQGLIPILIALQ
jgi:hypothetical protein